MARGHLDELLVKLNRGDVSAAEQVFRIYGPYLRMLVRRELRPALRAKFDSIDLVQSVWAEVLQRVQGAEWRFEDRTRLQVFLVRLVKYRFLDQCRKHRKELTHERSMTNDPAVESVESDLPRPSDVARRNELWDKMLALCPAAHHELLRLRLEGHTFAEIASRTGLHPSSVRRILHELECRLTAAIAQSRSTAGSSR